MRYFYFLNQKKKSKRLGIRVCVCAPDKWGSKQFTFKSIGVKEGKLKWGGAEGRTYLLIDAHAQTEKEQENKKKKKRKGNEKKKE